MLKFIVENGRFGFGWNDQDLVTANAAGWFIIGLTIWLFISGHIVIGAIVVGLLFVLPYYLTKNFSHLIDEGENHESAKNLDIEG